MIDFYSLVPLDSSMPEGTDFCIIMDSDTMEPLIPRGTQICVNRSRMPEEMEVGIFFYKDRIYCRQYCTDYAGNLHLLCANPLREKENLCLNRQEQKQCLCIGKVLLDGKPPMPIYF